MQTLAPEYAKAALRLAETHPSVVLAKVDATEESELAERFGIDGFPTLKWLTSGGEVDYTGGRTECVRHSSCRTQLQGPPRFDLHVASCWYQVSISTLC